MTADAGRTPTGVWSDSTYRARVIQSLSMSATEVVIGASDHYGRAELVTLSAEEAAPVFRDRRRVALIDEDLPNAPYHHEALTLEFELARELVERVRESVTEHARTAISNMVVTYHAQTLILAASPYDCLPDTLEEVLASSRLTLAADGMLYRESLASAAADCGLEVRRYPRKSDPILLAADAMGADVAEINALIARFGREADRRGEKTTSWRRRRPSACSGPV